ncbi:MAG: hypothetical protein RLY20_3401 [Verrucomicrobiota bacterium]|jgi:hypothetical protein
MSKKHKEKSAAPQAQETKPAASPVSPTQSGDTISPQRTKQISLAVVVGITAFFILRLFFLAHSSAPWDDAGAIDTIMRDPSHPNPSKLVAPAESPVVLMRQHWSYAPAQFFLTKELVKFAKNYTELLFYGRLPSLLLWYAGVLLAFWVFRQLLGDDQLLLSVALTIWTAFTLRGFVESNQSYNYAGGLPCSVFLLWLFVSKRGFAWLTEPNRLWMPIIAGLVAGMTGWFSYQCPFLVAGGFLMLGAVCLLRKNFAAFKGIIAAGIAFTVVIAWIWDAALKETVKNVSVTGGSWAGGVPTGSFGEKLLFLPKAWFGVIESNFSVVLPSIASVAIAAVFVALLAIGLVRIAKAKQLDPIAVRALVFAAFILIVWTGLAFLNKAPLSQSRHTYILQFPLLLVLGIALKYLPVPRKVFVAAAALLVAGFAVGAPAFWRSVENRFDEPAIKKLLVENPNAYLIQYRGGSSLDMFLLFREHPEWQQRVIDGTWAWPQIMQQLAGAPPQITVYTYGMQAPITDEAKAIAKNAGFEIVPLQDIAPIGSVEPWRADQYVGNGFHLYKLERTTNAPVAVPQKN